MGYCLLGIYVTDMEFSVCFLKVLLKGSVSQIFDKCPSYHFEQICEIGTEISMLKKC